MTFTSRRTLDTSCEGSIPMVLYSRQINRRGLPNQVEYVLPLPIPTEQERTCDRLRWWFHVIHGLSLRDGTSDKLICVPAIQGRGADLRATGRFRVPHLPAVRINPPPTGGRHSGQSDTPSPSRSSIATYRASFPARALADRDTIFRLSTTPPDTPGSSSRRGRPTPYKLSRASSNGSIHGTISQFNDSLVLSSSVSNQTMVVSISPPAFKISFGGKA
ncbi:hypothetical protein BU26DRAFT_79328 [Trematosphaeria pertusa]|uniref:Uncharacterized protein n=1 Tax=Trematosphaeria pertusa TaxID=390896 RepID=A0A6A6I430_9PLEO|nr:uncharacterized protein BU26DRAFT_79328 [Trematosphaeria pertusa]KAF2245254.1 hypothetical protein BU26DRAFT_79328 [Trematosphaeria pertusa]